MSKSRPDDAKLVGRCTLDLASIINQRLYGQPTEFGLQFCSVNASIVLSIHILDKVKTDISVSEFDRSYREELSMNSALKAREKTPDHFHRRRDYSPPSTSQQDSKLKNIPTTSREPSTQLSSRTKETTEQRISRLEEKMNPYRSMH